MIRFRCPQCDKSLKVSEEKAGRALACPRCGASRVKFMPEGAAPDGGDA